MLAFAVWGILAYKGALRLLARIEGLPLGGHVIIDILSLLIGVSGSIAGVSALWALGMRAAGRTPASLIGAPDDNSVDATYRELYGESTIGAPATPHASSRSDV